MFFSYDSTLVIATTADPELLFYDTETGEVRWQMPGTRSVLTTHERFLALTVPNQGCVVYAVTN